MLGWSRGGRVYFLADASWMHLQLACNWLATGFHCASLGLPYVYRSGLPPSFSPGITMADRSLSIAPSMGRGIRVFDQRKYGEAQPGHC